MAFSIKKWLNKWLDDLATTRLDDVSSVRATGYAGYLYIENDHEVTIGYDRRPDRFNILVYTSNLDYWRRPYQNEEITQAKREEILRKFCAFLDKENIRYTLQE